jgi:glycosyltransferase involved in cell wall biosynthesis
MRNKVKVSVIVISYNHEEFISECLDSILNQNCNFQYEILVGDDASSDSTAKLILEKQKQFPELLYPYVNKLNVGMNNNLANMIQLANGDFIAFCEGDDFWHNREKLQKQYDFLTKRLDHSMVYSDYGRLQKIDGCNYWLENTIDTRIPDGYAPSTYDLLKGIHIHISAIMAKTSMVREFLMSNYFNPMLKLGDVPMFLYLSLLGDVEYLKFSVSTYRLNPNSITNKSKTSRLSVVMDHARVCNLNWCELAPHQLKELQLYNKKRLFDSAIFALNPPVAIKNLNWASPRQIAKVLILILLPGLLEKRFIKAQKSQQLFFVNKGVKF